MDRDYLTKTLQRLENAQLSDPDEDDFGGNSDDDNDDDNEYPGNDSDQEIVDHEEDYDPDERYTLDLMRTILRDFASEAAQKICLYETKGKDPFIQFVTDNTPLNTIEATRIFFLMDAHCDIYDAEKAEKYILGTK